MITTIGVLIAVAIVTAGLCEFLKFPLFKNKAKMWQMTLLGLSLSSILCTVSYYAFTMLGKPLVIVLYSLIVFLAQREVDMKIIRPKIKAFIERKVDKL